MGNFTSSHLSHPHPGTTMQHVFSPPNQMSKPETEFNRKEMFELLLDANSQSKG